MKEKVALYLRLSRDDGMDSQESMSIGNQRAFLLRYVGQRGWTVTDTYVDDGYTGTNFDRPDFRRLIADIKTGRIDTVITKDLSRLGRDQIGTLHYLQVYFPSRRVRYIAVSEGIDTAQGSGITTPFLAAANDFYTADISRKVRAALDTRKQGGLFIGSTPPLGYQKDPDRKGHLVPDEETAWIIQTIFQDYLARGSVIGVAKALTETAVPTPSACKGTGPTQSRFPGVWSATMVRRILTNPTYAGHLTQNRRQKLGYKTKTCRSLPKKEWIVVPNTHEPLVRQEIFDQVQVMLSLRGYTPQKSPGHLLSGLVFCGDCGAPMTYVKDGTRSYMVCQSYRKGGRLGLCVSHMIREDAVIELIRAQLQQLAQNLDPDALCQGEDWDADRRQLYQQTQRLECQLERCKQVAASLYADKAAGQLEPREFRELFDQNRARRQDLEDQLRKLQARQPRENDREERRERASRLLRFDSLDRHTVTTLVDRVLIHQDKQVELHFKFKKPD